MSADENEKESGIREAADQVIGLLGGYAPETIWADTGVTVGELIVDLQSLTLRGVAFMERLRALQPPAKKYIRRGTLAHAVQRWTEGESIADIFAPYMEVGDE